MLANSAHHNVRYGSFAKELHFASRSLHELLDFIAAQLPAWRDDPDRQKKAAETELTSQLCGYLNTAARFTPGWDMLQFKPEEPDEVQRGRKIDMAVSPCGSIIWIEGRRCTQFDTLLPIECKRLPIPKGKDRDEREYVINRKATTGGIQRFKAGHHGAKHRIAGMIGFVQDDSPATWLNRLCGWIKELDGSAIHPGWSVADVLHVDKIDCNATGLTTYTSSHTRQKGLPNIDLRHLWIEMN